MNCFTPTTARRLLARIRPTVETLYRLYRELERLRPPHPESDRPVDPLYFAMSFRLARGLERLRADGLAVDELRRGMIDFPALLDRRPVMLCWRVGEAELFWHEPGLSGCRRPLPQDGPWAQPTGGKPLC
jgi:hypothetical protein